MFSPSLFSGDWWWFVENIPLANGTRISLVVHVECGCCRMPSIDGSITANWHWVCVKLYCLTFIDSGKFSTDHRCRRCRANICKTCASIALRIIHSINIAQLNDVTNRMNSVNGIFSVHWHAHRASSSILRDISPSKRYSLVRNRVPEINGNYDELFSASSIEFNWELMMHNVSRRTQCRYRLLMFKPLYGWQLMGIVRCAFTFRHRRRFYNKVESTTLCTIHTTTLTMHKTCSHISFKDESYSRRIKCVCV